MGHARALLTLMPVDPDMAEGSAKGLNVRQTEALVRRLAEEKPIKPQVVIKTRDDLRLEEALADTFQVLKSVYRQTRKAREKLSLSSQTLNNCKVLWTKFNINDFYPLFRYKVCRWLCYYASRTFLDRGFLLLPALKRSNLQFLPICR